MCVNRSFHLVNNLFIPVCKLIHCVIISLWMIVQFLHMCMINELVTRMEYLELDLGFIKCKRI